MFSEASKLDTRDVLSPKEMVRACLKQHVADFSPIREGSLEGSRSLSGGFIGAREANIDRCDPPVTIDRLLVERGKSVAFFGANGSGKSTVFDALMERGDARFNTNSGRGSYVREPGVHGREMLRIARLDQEELLAHIGELTADEVLELARLQFEEDFPIDWSDADAVDQNMANSDAIQRIEELMSRVQQLFEVQEFLPRKVDQLSGGERTKLSLLMLLSSEPDVLLLDEPTNHLDLESIAKLTGLFDAYKRAGVSVVNVSHVEWYLDMAGQDGTWELDTNKQERVLRASGSAHEKYKKREGNSRMLTEPIAWNMDYQLAAPGSSLFLTQGKVSIPDSPLKNIDVPVVTGGDMVIFSGKNGTGKTKLMDRMADKHAKDIATEKGVQIAYLPQLWGEDVMKGTVEHFFAAVKESINPHSNKTAAQFVKELKRVGFKNDARDFLQLPFSSLSGGEQRLLWFSAASIFEGTDLLLLDEPTNHMDSATMQIATQAIRDFRGAVVVSTHDIRLMQALEEDAGKIRQGQSIRNVVFEKKQGLTKVTESKQKPSEYASAVVSSARKKAGRTQVK